MDIRPIASGSSGNAYWISDGKTPLLLDAGITMKAIQIGCGFRVRELGGCFITHCHGDHSKAAKDLLRYGVDVYTGQGTAEACRLEGHRLHITRPLEQLTVGTFLVLPFDVEHDAPDSQGFLLESTATGEKLLYFTDTYYLKYRFSGITPHTRRVQLHPGTSARKPCGRHAANSSGRSVDAQPHEPPTPG